MWTLMLGWEGLLENHSSVELKSVFVISFSYVSSLFCSREQREVNLSSCNFVCLYSLK